MRTVANDHPTVVALTRAIYSGDEAATDALHDFLEEHGDSRAVMFARIVDGRRSVWPGAISLCLFFGSRDDYRRIVNGGVPFSWEYGQ